MRYPQISSRHFLASIVAFFCATLCIQGQPVHGENTSATRMTTLVSGVENNQRSQQSVALFNSPTGVALDSVGNIIVADAGHHRICRVSPKGVMTVLAGGMCGSEDGTGSKAQFFSPLDVAVDSKNNIIVLDGNRIRRISPFGVVTTVAGSERGCTDGFGTIARFNFPVSLAVDKQENIIVADAGNNRIRSITHDGEVTTLSEIHTNNEPSKPLALARLVSLTVDREGHIIVVDRSSCVIRRIIRNNGSQARIDSIAYRCVAEAQLRLLTNIAVDNAGNLIAIEQGGERIRKISPTGIITTIASNTNHTSQAFFSASDLALDAQGNIIITDSRTGTLRKIILP